jgi:hypothetical protein
MYEFNKYNDALDEYNSWFHISGVFSIQWLLIFICSVIQRAFLILFPMFISVFLNAASQAATPFANVAMFECLCPSLILNNLSC